MASLSKQTLCQRHGTALGSPSVPAMRHQVGYSALATGKRLVDFAVCASQCTTVQGSLLPLNMPRRLGYRSPPPGAVEARLPVNIIAPPM